jgi:hypothetical protein
MTNEEILRFAASMNYAHLPVDSSCHIGYGRACWREMVPELTDEKREKLVARIEHWQAMIRRETSDSESIKKV